MAVRNLQFVLSGSDKSASRALDKVGGKADGLGKKLAGVGKAAAFGVAGVAAAAVGGLAAAMVQGIKDAQSYETLGKKTAAVIESTGKVANVSAESVRKLAGDLESMSGVDEELIINGQNVLLTFTNIRNELGKDNKIFDRATEAALNMSVALGQDMQGSVTMLGKALNDPIKGISAMGRAGIQFTEQQKKQIKTLVESGDTLGAQKIILSELETQFGGVAKAAGSGLEGSLARAKDAFGDLFRNIATPLLPKIAEWAEKFAVVVNDEVAPAALKFIDEFEKGKGAGGDFRATLEDLWEAGLDLSEAIGDAYEVTKKIVDFVREHGEVFGPIAKGVGLFAAAMKAAHIASGIMAINGPAAAGGITMAGGAAGANAGKMAAFGTAVSRSVGPVAALAAALWALDDAGKLGSWGSGDSAINRLMSAIGKGDAKGAWDALWGEGFGWNDLGWEGRRDERRAENAPKPAAPRPGSSQDRPGPLNPTTPSYPRTGQVGGFAANLTVNLDGQTLAQTTGRVEQSRRTRGYVPAMP